MQRGWKPRKTYLQKMWNLVRAYSITGITTLRLYVKRLIVQKKLLKIFLGIWVSKPKGKH